MMNCDQTPGLMSVDMALQHMQASVSVVTGSECVALTAALDRILSQAIYAPMNVPCQDNSAMDGYALCLNARADASLSAASDAATEQNVRWPIIGEALAGHPFSGTVAPGQCVRIMTGADIPLGANCVVMQENVQRVDEPAHLSYIELNSPVRLNDNIRRCGEDIRLGECVFEAGRRIGPVDMGLLASLGMAQVTVYRRLRVAVVTTGDELVKPGTALLTGQLYDSNRYVLLAMLQRLAVEVVDLGIIADDLERLTQTFRALNGEVDALISSGGVSVGDADYTRSALQSAGDVNFWKVAMKPGKPFAFGHLGDVVFFGLPGNPVSAVVTCHQLALPILRQMAGELVTAPIQVQANTRDRLKKSAGRADFQRGVMSLEAGENVYRSIGAQGSGVLTSLSRANAYALLALDQGPVAAGDSITVLPFDRYLT